MLKSTTEERAEILLYQNICWTWRPKLIRQSIGNGIHRQTDSKTVRQLPTRLLGVLSKSQRLGLPPNAWHSPTCVWSFLSYISSNIFVWLKRIKNSQIFLDHYMFLFSRNITLVVKEHTFSLKCKDNFGDLL